MKKIKTAVMMLIIMCSLSGCVRMKAGMNIDSKGNADISFLYAFMDTSAYDDSDDSGDDIAESMREFEEKGWDVSEYDRDGYKGFTASLESRPLRNLANNVGGGSFGDMLVTHKGSKYTIDWEILDDDDRASMKGYENYITRSGGYMTFELTLPKEAISSNATSVSSDGRTLTWDLLNMSENKIHVEFALFNPMILVGIAAAVCVVALIIVITVLKSKKKRRPA